jgi:ABC-type multidrug transport system fused ATPase/permease subunit
MSEPQAKSSAWSRLRFLLGDRSWQIVLLVLVSVLAGLMESVILTVVAQAAAALVNGAKRVDTVIGPLHVNETLGTLLAAAFALATVRLALMAPISILPARIAANVQGRLRLNLFSAFTHATWTAQSRDREGYLQELMTNQVTQASAGASQAAQCMSATLSLLVLVVSALLLNVLGAVFVLVAAVLLFGLLRPLNELGARYSRELSQAQLNFANGVGEATRLAQETHVFGVATAQLGRVDELVGSARKLYFRTQLLGNLVPNFYRAFIYVIVVVGLGALNLAHAGHVASLGAVVLLLVRAGGYGQAAQGSYVLVRQATPFIERLQEAERRYMDSVSITGEQRLEKVRTLAFESVSFSYTAGRPVLSDISFDVRAGEGIGIVGPSGAGKSTLVQILLRLRIPEEGRYLVNGVSADQLARADWHTQVAYVPQEPRLLHASVADNIRYFREIDDAAVWHAARLAHIHDDIAGWPQGYDTLIGPRADAISGGQQQRICIARALAASPTVLVLDEPTSALDPRSERLLQESLFDLKERLTLFVIAHRMSTVDICDRVMVVVDGRLDAFDTVKSLKLDNAYYRSVSSADGAAIGLRSS